MENLKKVYKYPPRSYGYVLCLAACKEFVRKVECGEARSTRSYKQMKEAIAMAESER